VRIARLVLGGDLSDAVQPLHLHLLLLRSARRRRHACTRLCLATRTDTLRFDCRGADNAPERLHASVKTEVFSLQVRDQQHSHMLGGCCRYKSTSSSNIAQGASAGLAVAHQLKTGQQLMSLPSTEKKLEYFTGSVSNILCVYPTAHPP